MFNALNRFISRLDGEAQPHHQKEGQGFGFQVLRNTNLELAVEPWFDFVVGINGRMIESPDPRLFAQEVQNCAGGIVALGLWSAKGQRTRVMHIPVPIDTKSLGLSLQWQSLVTASNIWHVLDVAPNSPADLAGLLPYSDYILGTPDASLHGESALGELVEDYMGRPLRLWVYNNEYNVTREVTIQPRRDWGGEGILGCVLGFGALHRLPAPLSEPVSAPGETMFDGGDNTGTPYYSQRPSVEATGGDSSTFVPAAASTQPSEFLVPASMAATGTPPPPSGGGATMASRPKKKDRGHHGPSPNRLMDDYFAEEEKRSKELEGHISASRTPPPPPPKAGGGASGVPPPPKAGTPKLGLGTASATPPPPPAATAGPPKDQDDDEEEEDSEDEDEDSDDVD